MFRLDSSLMKDVLLSDCTWIRLYLHLHQSRCQVQVLLQKCSDRTSLKARRCIHTPRLLCRTRARRQIGSRLSARRNYSSDKCNPRVPSPAVNKGNKSTVLTLDVESRSLVCPMVEAGSQKSSFYQHPTLTVQLCCKSLLFAFGGSFHLDKSCGWSWSVCCVWLRILQEWFTNQQM